jgi:hypothetical protein
MSDASLVVARDKEEKTKPVQTLLYSHRRGKLVIVFISTQRTPANSLDGLKASEVSIGEGETATQSPALYLCTWNHVAIAVKISICYTTYTAIGGRLDEMNGTNSYSYLRRNSRTMTDKNQEVST